MTTRLRLAILGCGAVVERVYLPVLETHPQFEIAALVDTDTRRLEALGTRLGVPAYPQSWETFARTTAEQIHCDVALVCLPHRLHAPAAVALLRAGMHVLCEKPMATTAAECDAMLNAALEQQRVLMVAHVRRYYRKNQVIDHLLHAGELGEVESFEFTEGFDYRWPTASGFFFDRELAGGGVLIDTGAHTLDLARWWFGAPISWKYHDDNHGGVEANCELTVEYQGGVQGRVRLSRTDPLGDACVIRGRRATLTTSWDVSPAVAWKTGSFVLAGELGREEWGQPETQTFHDAVGDMVTDFADACLSGSSPRIRAVEAAEVVRWIEVCYAKALPLDRPWELVALQA